MKKKIKAKQLPIWIQKGFRTEEDYNYSLLGPNGGVTFKYTKSNNHFRDMLTYYESLLSPRKKEPPKNPIRSFLDGNKKSKKDWYNQQNYH